MFQVKLAESADDCITLQVRWYQSDESRGGTDLAERWFDLLHAAFASLATNPHRHSFAPENGTWQPTHALRQMLFRPWKSAAGWRVIYTIDESAKLVTILQVRHEHRVWLSAEDE